METGTALNCKGTLNKAICQRSGLARVVDNPRDRLIPG